MPRKIINMSIIIISTWLIATVLHLPEMLLNFLLVGKVPGLNTYLSPTLMMAIMTATMGIIIFEIVARRYDSVRQWRRRLLPFS